MTWKPPMTTSTIIRADGTPFEYEHVDHAALLDTWDDRGSEVWMLDVGDVHNVVEVARGRIDAVLALCNDKERFVDDPYDAGLTQFVTAVLAALGVTE